MGLKEVAIRLLHEGASVEEEVTFLQEAAIHGQFSSHPNVMQLHGLVTLRNPVILEVSLCVFQIYIGCMHESYLF